MVIYDNEQQLPTGKSFSFTGWKFHYVFNYFPENASKSIKEDSQSKEDLLHTKKGLFFFRFVELQQPAKRGSVPRKIYHHKEWILLFSLLIVLIAVIKWREKSRLEI